MTALYSGGILLHRCIVIAMHYYNVALLKHGVGTSAVMQHQHTLQRSGLIWFLQSYVGVMLLCMSWHRTRGNVMILDWYNQYTCDMPLYYYTM
jgi:hypothetical protein